MKVVSLLELLNSFVDDFSATGLSHRLSRVVNVAASAVPVALDRLGVETDDNAEVLSDSAKEISESILRNCSLH